MNFPQSITIVKAVSALDGGSIALEVVDEHAQPRSLMLDRSFAARREGRQALSVDDEILAIGSPGENQWIELVTAAALKQIGRPTPPTKLRPNGGMIFVRDPGLRELQESFIRAMRCPKRGQKQP